MIRICGNKVEIIKYKINTNDYSRILSPYATSVEEAEEKNGIINGVIENLQLEDDAWMDGLVIEDCYDVSKEVYRIKELGQEKYLKELQVK